VSSETLELHGAHAHDDHAHADHAHQFDDAEQQRDAAHLGMWAFLATEVLFFGGLFMIYVFGRYRFSEMWDVGSHMLDWRLGGLNTVILLCSSLTMALGVWAAQTGQTKKITLFLSITLLFAFGFLVVKSYEYYHKYEEHLIPGANFQVPAKEFAAHAEESGYMENRAFEPANLREINAQPALGHGETHAEEQTTIERPPLAPVGAHEWQGVRNLQFFFALYFAMTGLHAFHVIIGIGLIASLIYLNWKGWFTPAYSTPVVVIGLYWHFVDIVWVFLYPLLYLMDRAAK
jgi:cytochrome c oxidase subunit 3